VLLLIDNSGVAEFWCVELLEDGTLETSAPVERNEGVHVQLNI
jgi:hypothetical protein